MLFTPFFPRSYITKTLESENASISYVGVFLLKEHSVLWIAQLKELLNKCIFYLQTLVKDNHLNVHELQNILIVFLHTIVSFTSINTWTIFKAKNCLAENLRVLKPGLNQLCNNVVGYLIQHDFYITLKVYIFQIFNL